MSSSLDNGNNLYYVVFPEVFRAYSKEENVVVDFLLNPKMKGSTRDWVGIYEVGWNCYETPLTFEWGLGRPRENCSSKRRIIFTPKDIEKAKPNLKYQFVYINKYLEVLGESPSFSFVESNNNEMPNTLSPKGISSNLFCELNSGLPLIEVTEARKEEQINTGIVNRCQFGSVSTWENICTTCSECKHISQILQIQEKIINKLKGYTETSKDLEKRLTNVEYLLRQIYPLVPPPPWDRRAEENCLSFVRELIFDIEKEEGSGFDSCDGVRPQRQSIDKVPQSDYGDFNLMVRDISQKELMLKAVVGQQENKIRELTNILCKCKSKASLQETQKVDNYRGEDVIVLLRAEEKIFPEVCTIVSQSSDDDNSLKEDLPNKEKMVPSNQKGEIGVKTV